jgi:protein O-mannosyl-transferase
MDGEMAAILGVKRKMPVKTKLERRRRNRRREVLMRTSPAAGDRFRRNRIIACGLGLIILSIAIYLPTLRHPFATWDDPGYVAKNPHVLAGLDWSTLQWAFTTTEMGNWHPLTWISHALDVELFGQDPAGHHFSSIALHGVNSALLFLFLVSATGAAGRSFVVAALFAIHPLNVESVAWIAERKSVLSTMWFFSALLAYVWYARHPDRKRYLAVAALFLLGLAAKPMVVTLPFVALLLDYWPLNRISEKKDWVARKLLVEKLPLMILAAASCVMTLWAQGRAHAVSSLGKVTVSSRVQNAVYSYAVYVWKIVWPTKLAILYPLLTLSRGRIAAAALFLVGVTALVFRVRRPYLMVGWFWFLGTLVPVIGIVQVGEQSMADRYAYIPEIGIFLMAVWGIDELAGRVKADFKMRAAVIAAVLFSLLIVAEKQIGYWSTNVRLWEHASAVTKNNFLLEDKVGVELIAAGRPGEAYLHFENALRINPSDPLANFDIGARFHSMGMLQEAIRRYEVTVAQDTSPSLLADGYENLGAAYRQLGDFEKAGAFYRKTLEYDPQRTRIYSAIKDMENEEVDGEGKQR